MAQLTRSADRPKCGGIASSNGLLCVSLMLVLGFWIWIQIQFDTSVAQIFRGVSRQQSLKVINKVHTETVQVPVTEEVNVTVTDDVAPSLKAQFCTFCIWRSNIFCVDRIDYLMSQYGMTRGAALENVLNDPEGGCKKKN